MNDESWLFVADGTSTDFARLFDFWLTDADRQWLRRIGVAA